MPSYSLETVRKMSTDRLTALNSDLVRYAVEGQDAALYGLLVERLGLSINHPLLYERFQTDFGNHHSRTPLPQSSVLPFTATHHHNFGITQAKNLETSLTEQGLRWFFYGIRNAPDIPAGLLDVLHPKAEIIDLYIGIWKNKFRHKDTEEPRTFPPETFVIEAARIITLGNSFQHEYLNGNNALSGFDASSLHPLPARLATVPDKDQDQFMTALGRKTLLPMWREKGEWHGHGFMVSPRKKGQFNAHAYALAIYRHFKEKEEKLLH